MKYVASVSTNCILQDMFLMNLMPLLPSVSLCSLSFVLLFIILVLVVLTYADKSVINGSPICCFGDEVGHAWWLDEPNLQT